MEKNRQVYSTDSKANAKCPVCKEILAECLCERTEPVVLDKIRAVLSLEKSGRAGKVVTLVSQLPKSLEFLKELLSGLKQKCGAGGTSYIDPKKNGCVEIQGDQKEAIRSFLSKKGIKVK
jgi:translation initiation factor 1